MIILKDKYCIASIILIALFIVFKISYLNLPHFWDESWSYARAIHKMYEQGPTLLPGYVDVDATRGHPLFYYFITSLWMKVFGISLISKHVFALIIAVLTLISAFIVNKILFSSRAGFLAVLWLSLQIPFFIQSTLLLPEILVALLSLLSLYFVAIRQYWAISLSMSLLLLTKESGSIMGIVMLVYYLYVLVFEKDKSDKLKLFIALAIPAVIITGFYAYQYIQYGWIFYPEHMNYLTDSKQRILDISIIGLKEVFELNYKYLLWSALFSIMIVSWIWNKKFPLSVVTKRQWTFIILAIIFMGGYLFFTGLNFYTYRYLLPVIVLSVQLFTAGLDQLLTSLSINKTAFIAPLILILIGLPNFYKSSSIDDVSMDMKDAVLLQQNIITYVEKNVHNYSSIGIPSYQQFINLQDASCGFIAEHQYYPHVKCAVNDTMEMVVFDNIELHPDYESYKNNSTYSLLYRKEIGRIWGEIYVKN